MHNTELRLSQEILVNLSRYMYEFFESKGIDITEFVNEFQDMNFAYERIERFGFIDKIYYLSDSTAILRELKDLEILNNVLKPVKSVIVCSALLNDKAKAKRVIVLHF
ncbi:TPA: hypothetical protein ACOP7N_002053 [Streptococcus pneumoniae]|nr:Uncharacterised protein [Streptococcus pneumoniae]